MRKTFQILIISSLIFLIISPAKIIAQSDTTKKEAATYAPLIEFSSIQKGDKSVDLKTSVKAKINGTLTKLAGLKVEFTIGADSIAKILGEAITDSKGVALFTCKPDQLTTDKEGKLNFKASFAKSKNDSKKNEKKPLN